MYLVIVCYPVRDVIKFEIYLSFLIKLFSYMTRNLEQKLKYIKEQKEILSWNKKHLLSFLKYVQLPEIV